MAESPKPLSPKTQSFIPIVAPRPTRTTLPSSLSLPQLQHTPHHRRTSGSTLAVGESPGYHIPQNSGISSFRSLRNLLPFGNGGKQQASHNTPSPAVYGPKNSFPNFGSVRRSMQGERKNSASFPRIEQPEPSPVISIEASPQYTDTETETDRDTSPYESTSSSGEMPHASPGSQVGVDATLHAPPSSPGLPLGDLSTIIEAETSGISKHIPNLDDSQELLPKSAKTSTSESRAASVPVGPKDHSYIDMESNPAADTDTSGLDLDTSKLTAEVLSAMMMKEASTPDNWLNGVDAVVVDDPPEGTLKLDEVGNEDRDHDLSFNLGSLDPDLAALLSPHRMAKDDQTMFGVKPSLMPSPPIGPPSRRLEQPPSRSISRTHTPRSPSPQSPKRPEGFFTPAPHAAEAQSSPAHRRSVSVSLTRSTTSNRPTSLSALPRLARSVTSNPFRQGTEWNGSRSASPQTSPEGDDPSRRPSLDQGRKRQPPSPLSANSHSGVPNHSAGDINSQRHLQSRLATPARRTASHSNTNAARPPLRHLTTTSGSGSGTWETDSTTPSSRAPSSVGTATSSRRRMHYPRPSADEGRDMERTFLQHRTRKRSMSLNQHGDSQESISPHQTPAPPTRPSSAMSARRPAAEWLGPRTAKAFAAAGLLDHEKASQNAASLSRYGSVKGGMDPDPRAQYNAPTRNAFSELSASSSSWGRSRSASRTFTMSEAGGALADSPTLSTTPRTTFSGGSSAQTSISASSSMTQTSLNAAIQSMKEKHGVETEALLSALSDSQRTTKMLREENNELRVRIQELEGTINQLRHSPLHQARSLSRMVYDRKAQPILENGLPRRPQSYQHNQLLHPHPDTIPPSITPERDTSPNPFKETTASLRRRFSTTSSNFHLPPSNMSLLMHEADVGAQRSEGFSSRSGTPPSPTLVMPKRSSSLRHAHNRSMSSGGNISPTTANFSMTGSPGSLYLRPEHEMHLGDMASLDLGLVGEDSGDDDGL